MHEVALDLLILLAGIWLVAVTLRPLGLIEPSEAITLLAEIGIFFLMFHAGVETQPTEFLHALKRSLGVAVVGATFVGLTMTATAVVIGRLVYPRLGLPFRSESGKGFTFVLLAAIAMGLFAEAIGLHMILGAYLAVRLSSSARAKALIRR